MFKKITLGIVALLLSVNLHAGDYDGLWQSGDEFFTINQNGDQLLMVGLDNELKWWAEFGTISGNTAQMKTLVDDVNAIVEFTLTFTSATEATAVIVSCTGTDCVDEEDSAGTSAQLKKIF